MLPSACSSFASSLLVAVGLRAQTGRSQRDRCASRERVDERIRALQAEADRLAAQARTLLGDLRQLEIERDIACRASQGRRKPPSPGRRRRCSRRRSGWRHSTSSASRSFPISKARLVDIYKRGRGGYARLLFDVHGVREFARATRAVAALDHRSTSRGSRTPPHAGAAAAAARRDARARRRARGGGQGRRPRALAAERAVAAREALIAQIDERRDLNAQLAGELHVAAQRLQAQIANLAAGRPCRSGDRPAGVRSAARSTGR